MSKKPFRTPRNYNGTETTTRFIGDVLGNVLSDLGNRYKDQPDLVLASWGDLIGPKLSPMTKAVSFIEGVLTVKVMNSTLYSLLNQYDKPKLLQALREKFPKITIKTILFRMG